MDPHILQKRLVGWESFDRVGMAPQAQQIG